MNSLRLASLMVVIFNINFIYTEPNIPGNSEISYGENAENYYSNFNQPYNAITTVLPALDSDGTSNVIKNGQDDDASVPHWIDNRIHYFRHPPGNIQNENHEEISLYNEDVPDNFLDIRGKKFVSFYPLRLYPKRAPSGFLGLRGKKQNFNDIKRVPSGFTGMRGKKSKFEDNNYDDNRDEQEPSNDSRFYELLQEKNKMLNELNEIYRLNREINNIPVFSLENEIDAEKRAPSGFLGMRGKKAQHFGNAYSSEKRAPLGFLGVRGKRENVEDYNEKSKRGPFASFLGMRGKKEPLM